MRTLDARTPAQWRKWLKANHNRESEIWLVFYKRHTGISGIKYDDAVDEALCFGWVDSLIKRLDDARFARKFTPRKTNSKWSTSNRKRYAALKSSGRLATPGKNRAPTKRSGDAPRPSGVPSYIRKALSANAAAWKQFQLLAPSHRRNYVAWIDAATKPQTKQRRLDEAVRLLSSGKKLGLK